METWSEVYTGPQVELRLATRRSAVFVELTVDGGGCWSQGDAVVEFLLQGQDRLGLAMGPPTRVHSERVPLRRRGDDQDARGSTWLSSPLDPALLRRCHLRVSPDAAREPKSSPSSASPAPSPDAE
jgi:hypothetical protein